MTSTRTIRALLAAGALAAASIRAQAPGRLSGVITDENGTPLSEVQVTVTDPEVESFRLSTATNKKGKYAFLIKDVTRPYLCQFEKEGFQTLEVTIKIPFNANLEKDLTMPSLESLQTAAQTAPALAGSEARPALVPSNPAVLVFNEGAAAVAAGDLATAESKFEEAIALDPELVAPHAALSALRLGGNRFAEAAEAAEKALALDPENVRALQIRYQAYKALGDDAKTQQALSDLQAADPEAALQDLYNQGVELFNGGRIGDAEKLFSEVLEVDPRHARSHYMLGMCFVNSGKNEMAREHLSTFVDLAPDDVDAATARATLEYLAQN